MIQEKLTVGFVLDEGLDKPDGVQQYILGLGGWLQSRGHDVHYLVGESRRKDIANVHVMSKNVKVSFNGNKLTIPLASSKKKIKRVLAENKFDILHVQVPYSPLMGGRVISCAADDTAIVGTFHVLPYGRLTAAGSGLLGLITRFQNKYFDQFFAVSEPARAFARDKFRIQASLMPNFVDGAKYKKSKKSPAGQARIIFVGRLVKRKGCRTLLEAINHVQKNRLAKTKISVDICGGGPQKGGLKKYCQKNRLANIKFHGFVSEAAKRKLLSESDIAVYPSMGGESFGIVLLEAMASGCVVIAGDNPGYRSVLSSAPESLVRPNSTESFAELLAKTIDDTVFRRGLLSAQQKLAKGFSLNRVAERILLEYYRAKHDKLRKTNG
jgi:phosphatidylinositol alpha-mannosyltransferase